jgi:hypothetical protein
MATAREAQPTGGRVNIFQVWARTCFSLRREFATQASARKHFIWASDPAPCGGVRLAVATRLGKKFFNGCYRLYELGDQRRGCVGSLSDTDSTALCMYRLGCSQSVATPREICKELESFRRSPGGDLMRVSILRELDQIRRAVDIGTMENDGAALK